MAEETLGKIVDQLKKDRTKSSFTKQANFLCREAHRLLESELKDEFKKLSSEARNVSETMMITGLGYWQRSKLTKKMVQR